MAWKQNFKANGLPFLSSSAVMKSQTGRDAGGPTGTAPPWGSLPGVQVSEGGDCLRKAICPSLAPVKSVLTTPSASSRQN